MPWVYSLTAYSATSRTSLACLNEASPCWVVIFWLVRESRRAAESSSQTTSPSLTLVPSGLIMMMVVPPSTSQRTSLLAALSRFPFSLTITESLLGRTCEVITSALDAANSELTDRFTPGTPTPTTTAAAIPPTTTNKVSALITPDRLRGLD